MPVLDAETKRWAEELLKRPPPDDAQTPEAIFFESIRSPVEPSSFLAQLPPSKEDIPEIEGETPQFKPDTEDKVPILDQLRNAPRAVMRGAIGTAATVPQAAAGLQNEWDELLQRWLPEGQLPKRAREDKDVKDYANYQLGQSIKEFAEKWYGADPRLKDAFLAETLPNAVGSMGAFMLTTAATTALGLPPVVGAVGLGSAAESAGHYEAAIIGGASEDEARAAAALAGPLGVLEAAPIMRILGRFNKASGGVLSKSLTEYLKQGLFGGAEEAITEFFQTSGGNVIAKKIVKYDEDGSLLEGTLDPTGAGGIVGFMANAIATAAGVRVRGAGQPPSPAGAPDTRQEPPEGTQPQPTAADQPPEGPIVPPGAPRAAETARMDADTLATAEGAARFAAAEPELARELAAEGRLSRRRVQGTAAAALRINADKRQAFLGHLKAELESPRAPLQPTVPPRQERLGPEGAGAALPPAGSRRPA
ncbi:MAG: hypothetical protein ACYTAF_14900, partial [Planctomycetota bacterium]